MQKYSKSIANRQVEDWEASNGHTKNTTRMFTVRDTAISDVEQTP